MNRRFLCQSHEETIDHILLHCDKTRVRWEFFLSFFGVTRVFLTSVRCALEGWRGTFVGKKRGEVWKAGPYGFCFFYYLEDKK